MGRKRRRTAGERTTQSGFEAAYYRGGSNPAKTRPISFLSARKLINILIIMALISGILLMVHNYTRVTTVEVEGVGDAQLRSDITESVEDDYSWLWQVYMDRSYEPSLELPENIESVKVTAQWRERILHVSVDGSRDTLATWHSGDASYIIDTRGIVIREVESTDENELPEIVDESGLEVGVGDRVGSRDFADFVSRIASSLPGMERLRVIGTTRELYADLDTGYYIRFNTEEEAGSQLDNVARVQALAEDSQDAIEDYIDVRIPYKAYYR